MRWILLFSIVSVVPAAAAERDADLDRYFSCLVGQAAVELHYGATAIDAYTQALFDCSDFHAVVASKNKDGRQAEDTAKSLIEYVAPAQDNGL